MNIHDLREAQVRYENRIEQILEGREKLYQLRSAFVRYFNRNRIRTMQINDYVAGVDLPERGFNFCYALERQLDGLGRIIGATAFKFGVYYGRTRSTKIMNIVSLTNLAILIKKLSKVLEMQLCNYYKQLTMVI